MPPALLNLTELTLIRYWLHGLPNDVFADHCQDGNPTKTVCEIRTRLRLKARRLQVDWGEDWLERRPAPGWTTKAMKRVEWLQQIADVAPCHDQPLAWWLPSDYLGSLQSLDLATVADWINLRQTQGAHWWRTVDGLGRTRAQAIEDGLCRHFPDAAIPSPIQAPLPVYQTAVVPMEQFLLPMELDGSEGGNRCSAAPFIPAQDDYQAITCWLKRLDPASHTHRGYKREAERLLLWSILDRRKALSSLDMTDMSVYRKFLENPQPPSLWVGPKQRKGKASWKPFTGPLSQTSRRFTETVIHNLFAFLVDQRYLMHNPLSALPKLKDKTSVKSTPKQRAFTEEQWFVISQFIHNQTDTHKGGQRLKWLRVELITQLGYSTGLRLHELAQAKVGDIDIRNRAGKTQYWLIILGKGQKYREVPLPITVYLLINEIHRQLHGRPLTLLAKQHPLIPHLRGQGLDSLMPLALHNAIKGAFAYAAEALRSAQPEMADKLEKASTHWLRHTHGSVSVEKGVPLPMVRDNLGHASINTTSIYVHSDDDARYDFMNNQFMKFQRNLTNDDLLPPE